MRIRNIFSSISKCKHKKMISVVFNSQKTIIDLKNKKMQKIKLLKPAEHNIECVECKKKITEEQYHQITNMDIYDAYRIT